MKVLLIAVLALVGCGEQQIVMDADAGVLVDAGWGITDAQEEDAGQDRGDAGAPDGAAVDASDGGGLRPDAAAPPDAGTPLEDAAVDSSVPPDADMDPVTDASVDAAPTDAGTDAGPPSAPVGAAVDVTGSRCALDSVGNLWCWGRWTPVEDVRLLGTGFDRAWGSCAMRGDEVWCVHPSYGFPGVPGMLRVIEAPTPPETPLRVDFLAEYSDYQRGCGGRRLPDSTWEVLCWRNGYAVVEWTYPDSILTMAVAVTAAGVAPRTISYVSNVEMLDINMGFQWIALDGRVYDPSGEFMWDASIGTHWVIGFALACAYDGLVRCKRLRAYYEDWSLSPTGFRDHAVTWPIGAVDPTAPYAAHGLCVGGDFGVRCYDDNGTLAYTVNW